MTVRQRRSIPLSLTVKSVLTMYPRRTVLGLGLFIGQAFLYNSILFGLGDFLGTYFKVVGDVPYYLVVFARHRAVGHPRRAGVAARGDRPLRLRPSRARPPGTSPRSRR